MRNIAIIGSGFCGLTIARKIRSGLADVSVYDKGGRPGGRVASKTFGGRTYDYGPAFLPGSLANNIPTDQFNEKQLWPGSGSDGFTPPGGIANFASQMANEIKSYQFCPVIKCLCKGETFSLVLEKSVVVEDIDTLVVTAPAEQSAELVKEIAPLLSDEIRQTVRMLPTWVVLLEIDQIIELDPLLEVNSDIVKNIRSEHTKVGRRSDTQGSWFVIECSNYWSKEYVDKSPEWVSEAILDWFRNKFASNFLVKTAAAHRWRYASTDLPLARDFLRDDRGDLWIAGDWCLGDGIASAVRSGKIVGDKINIGLR